MAAVARLAANVRRRSRIDGVHKRAAAWVPSAGGPRDWTEASAVRLSLSLFAVAIVTAATNGSAEERFALRPDANSATQAQRGGAFQGEYARGTPVYLLPAVTVIVSRKMDLADMDREEKAARAMQRYSVRVRSSA